MTDPVAVTERKVVPEVDPAKYTVGLKNYQPTMVRLYGVRLDGISLGALGALSTTINYQMTLAINPTSPCSYELAAIYGYSYEGKCYSLPKPCLVVVDSSTRNAASGCGYEGGYNVTDTASQITYSMWTADKLDRTLVLTLDQGFIEDVILQQNIAGPKAPAAYGTRVQLAHRGGKLND